MQAEAHLDVGAVDEDDVDVVGRHLVVDADVTEGQLVHAEQQELVRDGDVGAVGRIGDAAGAGVLRCAQPGPRLPGGNPRRGHGHCQNAEDTGHAALP